MSDVDAAPRGAGARGVSDPMRGNEWALAAALIGGGAGFPIPMRGNEGAPLPADPRDWPGFRSP